MLFFTTVIPLSLYIHIPWCVRKCPYCDFNSHELQKGMPEEQYIEALIQDLDQQLPKVWGRRLVSIFFGGGTPSLLKPQSIEKLLQQIHARIPFSSSTEITLEANPGTVDETHFRGFKAAGVNRLSLGIQSLQNEKLAALGRIHARDQALRAIESAVRAGFENFNLDLMHGLPNQSLEDALSDLNNALQFDPPHLSWYQLTIEPNTFFYHRPPKLPKDETLWAIQSQGKAVLKAAHLGCYEVSAYAKVGKACLHNSNYWEFGDYLGIGAGAHSKITNLEEGVITRYAQVKHPKLYLGSDGSFTAQATILKEKDIIFEFMLNALRLTRGVPAALFTERTGLSIASIQPILKQARQKKLLTESDEWLCPTELGRRFLNDLVELFLCE